jgi:uncharacterized protein
MTTKTIQPLLPDLNALGNPYVTSEDERLAALRQILQETPVVMAILAAVRDLHLQDGWLVSGGIYQTVWNALTGYPYDHGIKDYDVVYFDGSDLSYEAEDHVIKLVEGQLPPLANKLEIRNQARVHLWYEQRFGSSYSPLSCTLESLTTYASKTHAVAARLRQDGGLDIHAPFGLANIFAMRLVPNYAMNNRKTHEEKGVRMKALWPELDVVPWEQDEPKPDRV